MYKACDVGSARLIIMCNVGIHTVNFNMFDLNVKTLGNLYIYIKPKLLKLPQFSTSAQH